MTIYNSGCHRVNPQYSVSTRITLKQGCLLIVYFNKLWELNELMCFKTFTAASVHWRCSGNARSAPLPFQPCLSLSSSLWAGTRPQPPGQKPGAVCCHLVDQYLFAGTGVFYLLIYVFEASRNQVNLLVTDTGVSALLALCRTDLLFLPSAVLWKVLMCEAAEPEPIAFLGTGRGMQLHQCSSTHSLQSLSPPGWAVNRIQMEKGWPVRPCGPLGGTWTPESTAPTL